MTRTKKHKQGSIPVFDYSSKKATKTECIYFEHYNGVLGGWGLWIFLFIYLSSLLKPLIDVLISALGPVPVISPHLDAQATRKAYVSGA
jgi:hypothetical protein